MDMWHGQNSRTSPCVLFGISKDTWGWFAKCPMHRIGQGHMVSESRRQDQPMCLKQGHMDGYMQMIRQVSNALSWLGTHGWTHGVDTTCVQILLHGLPPSSSISKGLREKATSHSKHYLSYFVQFSLCANFFSTFSNFNRICNRRVSPLASHDWQRRACCCRCCDMS